MKRLIFIVMFFHWSYTGFAQENFENTGRVTEWKEGIPQFVEKPLFTDDDEGLENELVKFGNIPSGLSPNERGCYCYEEMDLRFTYVHIFYHATEQIRFFNFYLKKMGLPELRGVTLSVHKEKQGTWPSAAAKEKEIEIYYSQSAFDKTILAHEMGHLIHNLLISHFEVNPEITDFAAFTGIWEGFANVLAAIYGADPVIGQYGWFDASVSIDSFVRFPDLVPSGRDGILKKIKAPIFANHYPNTIFELQEELENPTFPDLIDAPEAYMASAAFNRHLWRAAQRFGNTEMLKVVFHAVAFLTKTDSYRDWTEALLKSSALNSTQDVTDQLRSGFSESGLCDQH